MRVAVTGTPGTGKTTATELVETDLDVIDLNDLVRSEELTTGTDEERDSLVADIDAIADRLADRDGILVESHLAHHLEADRVVVLRCRPEELERRLLDRGESERKAEENAEAEALDVILSEAVDRHGLDAVYEIDTTDRAPEAVAEAIEAVIDDERSPSAGTVDFTEYL
jgi:adenylate kinase